MFLMMLMTWYEFENIIRTPPHSLWFIFVVSFMVSLLSTTLNKLLVDHDQLNRQQEVITEHNARKKELMTMAEENPKKYAKEYAKWTRRDKSVQKMQQGMSMKRLKPTLYTFVPMIVFFYLVRGMYTGPSGIQLPVAKPAMNPIEEFPDFLTNMLKSENFSAVFNITIFEGFLGYTGYYILCSVSLSSILQKLMGIKQNAQGGGMSSMFDSSSQMELPRPGG